MMSLYVRFVEHLGHVYFGDSTTRTSVKVSLAAWEEFRKDIIDDAMTPQIRRGVLSIHIGDVPSAPILGRGTEVITSWEAWKTFTRQVKSGAFAIDPSNGPRTAVRPPSPARLPLRETFHLPDPDRRRSPVSEPYGR